VQNDYFNLIIIMIIIIIIIRTVFSSKFISVTNQETSEDSRYRQFNFVPIKTAFIFLSYHAIETFSNILEGIANDYT